MKDEDVENDDDKPIPGVSDRDDDAGVSDEDSVNATQCQLNGLLNECVILLRSVPTPHCSIFKK